MNKYEKLVSSNSLKDFFAWWQSGYNSFMEVRTQDWKAAKEIGTKYKLPYSVSGVFVNDYNDLLKVMKPYRKTTTFWMSVNPRKKYFNGKDFKTFGGHDYGVESLSYIFIDIDRKVKGSGRATEEQLEKMNEFADIIINDFKNANITDYCKIYSGNGFQVLVRLDQPISIPELTYEKDAYLYSETFDKHKQLIKQAIYDKIQKKYKGIGEKYNCEIDSKCWNMGRVCALPHSYNFKYKTPILRGVIEYGAGTNDGLSDALFEEVENVFIYNNKNKTTAASIPHIKITHNNLYNNKLIKFLIENKLPDGNRNSNLIFPLKCLLQQNGFDLRSRDMQELRRKIEMKQCDTFPFNPPNYTCIFNPNIVNNYCVTNFIPLLYPEFVISNKRIKYTYEPHMFDIDTLAYALTDGKIELEGDDTISVLYDCHRKNDGKAETIFKMGKALLNKFGLKDGMYIYNNYLKYWVIK